jgi:RNA polymerase sigma-70 factor (ECF subfamily)
LDNLSRLTGVSFFLPRATPDLRDPTAFTAAFDAHASTVHATALAVLGDPVRAQDVVQDVFLRLWRRPEAFDPARGSLGGYLRVMARSRAVDLWRESRASGRMTERLKVDARHEEPRADERPAVAAERAVERAGVQAALRELPRGQREAVVLAYWGGLPAERIARHERIPLGTAKSRVRLGLGKLRRAYGVPAPQTTPG